MKVLVVEDRKDSAWMVCLVLSLAGHECQEARSGFEAIERFESMLRDGQCFDVVIMDLQMPEMDGLQCMTKLREIEKQIGCSTPSRIVVLSAHLMDLTVDDVERLSIETVEQKPVDGERLRELVERRDLQSET